MDKINIVEKKEKILQVSSQFVEAYKLFNVIKVTDLVENLSRRERLLLLTLASDSFKKNDTLKENISPFKDELIVLYRLQVDEGDSADEDVRYLVEATGDKYIDTETLRMLSGDKLPKPLTEEEAQIMRRDLNIESIVSNE
jgi:hypothetical protein